MPKPSLHGRQCAYQDCTSQVVARGWCDQHYRNFLHHGDPGVYPTMAQAIANLPDEAWDRRLPTQRPDVRAWRIDARYPPREPRPQPEWAVFCCIRCLHLQPFPPQVTDPDEECTRCGAATWAI
jgi:hypothetical protein